MATRTIYVLQLCVQYLNSVISTITHVQFVIDDLDKTGFTELSWLCAFSSNYFNELPFLAELEE